MGKTKRKQNLNTINSHNMRERERERERESIPQRLEMQIFRNEKYPVSVSIQLFVFLGLSSTLPENLVQEISLLFFFFFFSCFSSMAERVKRHE